MWVKFDDSMPEDPDVDRLSHGAFRLYVSGICHAQKHLTDGFVDRDKATRLMRSFRGIYIDELVRVGLWDDIPGGYVIRNFSKFNRTRDYWIKKRETDAARIAAYRAAKDREESGQ